jgi:ferritin-like metal-binding protein YciE
MCTLAENMGLSEAKKLLAKIIEQEKSTDEKLTQIAMTVNREAVAQAAE